MNNDLSVLVLGASGYTGKLLIPLLKSKYGNIQSYSRAQDGELYDYLQSEAFLKSDIIINCIGPFNITGKEILEAVIKNGKKYIDISGELHFVKDSFDSLSKKAHELDALIIHSCAFESFFADHLVNLVASPNEEIESLSSYYKFDKTRPSRGTRASAKLHNYFSRLEVKNGQWQVFNEEEKIKEVSFQKGEFAYFAPYPEILFFKRRFKVKESKSYLLVSETEAGMLSAMNQHQAIPIEKAFSKLTKSKYQGPDEYERKEQKFELYIKAESNESQKVIKLSGKDMYLRTAEMIEATLSTLAKSNKKGIFSPFELIEDMSIFNSLCKSSNLLVEDV